MASDGFTWPAGRIPWERTHITGSTNVHAGMCEGMDEGRHDQHHASRVAMLEAGMKNTQSHNVRLRHHVSFLEGHMIRQLGHITNLQTRVRALESEVTSLKANLSVGPNPVPASSQAVNSFAAGSVAATPVAAGRMPPLSPAPTPAPDLRRPLPGQQYEPMPPIPATPGVNGSRALWDLRPQGAGGSETALTAFEQGENGAVPPKTMGQAAWSPSPRQEPEPAAHSFPVAPDDVQFDPLADSTASETAPAEPSFAVVTQQAENSSRCNSGTAVTASASSRHPLHDFWADNSREHSANPSPASNTRSRRLRDDSALPHQSIKSSLSNGHVASGRANADAGEGSESGNVGHTTRGAEERESTPAATTATKAELLDPSEPTSRAALPRTPVLRCATEGREGVEDRSSHLMDCAFCQDPLPEVESIGRCDACPRSYCTQCLERGLHEQGVDLEGLDQDCQALLDGGKGDFFVEQCPHCIRGCDDNFAAPSPGAVPMEHLLNELLRHDLSICFREPVDTNKHPDYVESIGRDAMMDLGTMQDKIKRKRYPRRRGPGQFLEDLNRIWRNCRKFAGCDELGRPHYGTTVPGIVRCALILEAMSIKFCAAYMPDNQGAEAWQESTWSFHRERQERMNAEARLEQLNNQGIDKMKTKPPVSSGVGSERVNVAAKQECGESSSSSGNAAPKLAGEDNDKLGDGSATECCSVQRPATDSSDCGGRKRMATEMGGAEHTGSSRARARSATRTMLEANGAVSGGKTKLQQPPWSPLDKLCDLASTF